MIMGKYILEEQQFMIMGAISFSCLIQIYEYKKIYKSHSRLRIIFAMNADVHLMMEFTLLSGGEH